MSATTTALAAAVRDACARAVIDAYEDAGMQGLCAEGRFEAAVGAIERVDLAAIVAAAGAAAGVPAGASAGASTGKPPAEGAAPAAAPLEGAAGTPAPLLRRATREDLPAIVALLRDEPPGARQGQAGSALASGHLAAFEAIERDPDCELLVACRGARLIGTMQLDYTPGLSRQGAWRATIETLRLAPGERSQGTARAMIEWAIARARSRGCRIVQLGSDRSRVQAHRFYERLGFVASRLGMQLELAGPD